jgi:lipid-binding SYLF domain-containing protein
MRLHRRRFGSIALAGGAATLAAAAARPRPAAAATRSEINAEVAAAMVHLRNLPGLSPRLLRDARATLIFPRIISGGFIVGGQYGEGAALGPNGDVVGYYSIAGVSLGLLAGAQTSGLAMFFMTDEAVQTLMRADGWRIGTDLSVVVLDRVAQVDITPTTELQPVYAVTFNQQGLMASLSLEGTKISRINPDA